MLFEFMGISGKWLPAGSEQWGSKSINSKNGERSRLLRIVERMGEI